MKKERNPYINRTLAEVKHAEEMFYYLQVGEEVPTQGGYHTFNKDRTEGLFWDLMTALRDMKDNGDEQEQYEAHLGLLNLKIHKLRIH